MRRSRRPFCSPLIAPPPEALVLAHGHGAGQSGLMWSQARIVKPAPKVHLPDASFRSRFRSGGGGLLWTDSPRPGTLAHQALETAETRTARLERSHIRLIDPNSSEYVEARIASSFDGVATNLVSCSREPSSRDGCGSLFGRPMPIFGCALPPRTAYRDTSHPFWISCLTNDRDRLSYR